MTVHETAPMGGAKVRDTVFAEILRAAMTARGVTVKALATEIGIQPPALSRIRFGHNSPSYATAIRLAEALDSRELRTIAAKLHRRRCAVCYRRFIDRTDNGGRTYCSRRCLTTAATRRSRQSRANRLHMEARRWREATKAIAVFCKACEWDGECKTPTCELRPFSPLPLIQVQRRAA